MSDVDGETISTKPDGLAGAPDLSQPHGGDGLPPIPVHRPDRARRVRSFVALITGYAAIFIWVAVVVRQRVGRDPSPFPRIPTMEVVERIMFYLLAVSLWVGSVALWKTARLGVEKSSCRASTDAMYVGGSVGIVLGLLFSGLDLLTMGWVVFPQMLVLELVFYPLVCLFLAAVWFKEPGKKLLRARWPRFSIRSLLAIIAYLCLLLGLGVSTAPLGQRARLYRQKARLYQYRFDICEILISGYESMARQTPALATGLRTMIEYYAPLASKYDRARKEPWIEVPPDPPLPGSSPPTLPFP
ncbi:MAG: hypothetical protein ACLQGP_05640 [Isosphaeraceae bacterium]